MRSDKPFDAPASEKEVKQGLATIVGKMVLAANRSIDDIDDAAELAGRSFIDWMIELSYDKDFVKATNSIIGAGQFNSEFFTDGLKASQ